MGEERQAAAMIGLVLLVGIAGLFLTGGLPGMNEFGIGLGDVYVDSYRADVYLNGTLEENYVYQISSPGKYRMLYRNKWNMPLTSQALNSPHVEALNITAPEGTLSYIRDWNGKVTVLSTNGSEHAGTIRSLAESNEAGCFEPRMFAAGTYSIDYIFRIHPFLECDGEYCHWNLMLADAHLPYRRASIYLHDPDDLLVQLFTHPAMSYAKEGDTWVITGSSPKDGLLEVEMLLKPQVASSIEGFPRVVPDVKAKTVAAQGSGPDLLPILRSLVLLIPLILAAFYYRFGREKRYLVPKTLSYVPSRRKPWLVNMVFKGDAFDFDPDGFYATLLDLHRRGIIGIASVPGAKIIPDTKIRILRPSEAGEDGYEQAVLEFLKGNSLHGVFDAQAFQDKVESMKKSSSLQEMHRTMEGLLHYQNRDAACEFAAGRSLRCLGNVRLELKHLYIVFYIIAFLFGFMGGFSILSNPLAATALILLLQSTLVAFAPSTLLGRWKQDSYKEKLEWDAFRAFLSDFAMIQKYAPQDINIWKEWLVYGTALGVGDKVGKALADLNIRIPEAVAVHTMHTSFDHAYSASSPKSGGSGGGGGFGGGGGGGGGGGAR